MSYRLTSTFYLVWCPTGGAPTVPHASLSLAAREAERLARSNPGKQFIVVKSITAYERNDITVTDLSHTQDDEPF